MFRHLLASRFATRAKVIEIGDVLLYVSLVSLAKVSRGESEFNRIEIILLRAFARRGKKASHSFRGSAERFMTYDRHARYVTAGREESLRYFIRARKWACAAVRDEDTRDSRTSLDPDRVYLNVNRRSLPIPVLFSERIVGEKFASMILSVKISFL